MTSVHNEPLTQGAEKNSDCIAINVASPIGNFDHTTVANSSSFLVLPALDLLNGTIVRAYRGERQHYQPLAVCWCSGNCPTAVAASLNQRYGFTSFYLADLDAILGKKPSFGYVADTIATGFSWWIDAGIRDLSTARALLQHESVTLVTGSESIPSLALLGELISDHGPDRVIFSCDLYDGQLVGSCKQFGNTPQAILGSAFSLGVRRFILIDLARVGTGVGVGTSWLVTWLKKNCPDCTVYVGGGIAGPADIPIHAAQGVAGVLVANSLYNGNWPSHSD